MTLQNVWLRLIFVLLGKFYLLWHRVSRTMVLVLDPWIVEVDLGCIHGTVPCRAGLGTTVIAPCGDSSPVVRYDTW